MNLLKEIDCGWCGSCHAWPIVLGLYPVIMLTFPFGLLIWALHIKSVKDNAPYYEC